MIIESFFLEEIVKSSDYQNIKVGYHSRIYLSKIMTKYSTQEGCDKLNKTIASLYIESIMEDKKTVRFQKYKEIGDTALAKVGLFPESISKVLSKGYFYDMGSVAYEECYRLRGTKMFLEISNNIEDFSEVIFGAKNCSITNNILELYELWRRTKSSFARKRLFSLGVIVSEKEVLE
jgi:hypothetical protein